MRHGISVPVHLIIVSHMKHRQLLLFTLAYSIFYCTLSASLGREINSSVIGRYRKREREREAVLTGAGVK